MPVQRRHIQNELQSFVYKFLKKMAQVFQKETEWSPTTLP